MQPSRSSLAVLLAVCAFSAKRRSEEHTSEFQSRLHLVCRLLLEKKKPTVVLVLELLGRLLFLMRDLAVLAALFFSLYGITVIYGIVVGILLLIVLLVILHNYANI